MSEALLVLDKVVKRFGEHTAVDGVDLQISKGEFLAIMGPSGCGKTTTLRMIAGLEQPSAGEIRLNGTRMNELKPWQRDTPLVWQNLALFPHLSVLKNVEFGLKMRNVAARERRERSMNWLERMGLAEYAGRNIAQLSGGERQRVAIARALVTEPEILLLDEPLSALDAHLRVRMQSEITQLQKQLGITFAYVTHNQSEAFAMASRVAIMNGGLIQQIGSP
ncbi:MAG: ABC transporter ATP-binding protein, partial [Rhodospirillaceae bacterium]|nr:ABC transporter ATP-binding protein [Rhodospirillaceae bacterium]